MVLASVYGRTQHIFTLSSNIDKIKNEAVWNDENQRWRIPELIMERTRLPPAGKVEEIRSRLSSIYMKQTMGNGTRACWGNFSCK